MSGAVDIRDRLPDEFDEVTSKIEYPEMDENTTSEEFVKKAGNGYLYWVVGASAGALIGVGVFMWGLYEILLVLQ